MSIAIIIFLMLLRAILYAIIEPINAPIYTELVNIPNTKDLF